MIPRVKHCCYNVVISQKHHLISFICHTLLFRLVCDRKTRVEDWCGLKEEEVLVRTKWMNNIQYHSGDRGRWEKAEKKKKEILSPSIAA